MLFVVDFDLRGWRSLGQFDRSCVFFCLEGSGKPQIIAKDHVEGLGQFAYDAVVIVNHQPFEEREVELAAHCG